MTTREEAIVAAQEFLDQAERGGGNLAIKAARFAKEITLKYANDGLQELASGDSVSAAASYLTYAIAELVEEIDPSPAMMIKILICHERLLTVSTSAALLIWLAGYDEGRREMLERGFKESEDDNETEIL